MASSSSASLGSQFTKLTTVRIPKNIPPPDEWVKVKEVTMENRSPCEIWRSGVNRQLSTMKEQMSFCRSVEEQLETEIQSIIQEKRETLSSESDIKFKS